MRSAIVLVLFGVAVIADDKADLKALDGNWTVEKFIINGGDQTDNFKNVTLAMDGGKYTVTVGEQKDQGTVSVDGSKTPKAMDVKGTEGPNKGKTYLCIYELKDDTLTICYSLDDKNRPAKLESAKDSNTMLVTYKKKK